ncbi:hypothetical protein OROHE_013798 [Orobanche hederae]
MIVQAKLNELGGYVIWKARNGWAFNGDTAPAREICYCIKKMVSDLRLAFCARPDRSKGKRSAAVTRWIRPPAGWFKQNTDASLVPSTGDAAAGGLIRDEDGIWVCGFSQRLKVQSINLAELLALRDGLNMAWDMRLRWILVEIDSEVVYRLFISNDAGDHPFHYLLEDCRRFRRLP